ncbi:leucine rich repeat protein [Spathaspora passalidarum NRRL Y-27907]|uniref:Leucine rich repeat protein n=1 Tax=Spathaspora passalidarum (strain NRRL Y-27907 / 11-Y1) TaxID=619300 RepID=G3AIE4_SPAPN|nr:leucine rich repeat protein [Spathaspora passalidarum NRRL Y-27907]EGW34414.1 leucine rich repeat protein [Spathaspora passalidarum NRRL Y-27907]
MILLPDEIIVNIFKYLSSKETIKLIKKLEWDPRFTAIVDLLYQRLYHGRLLIINEDPKQKFESDYELTVDSFEDMFTSTTHEHSLFRTIRPNYVEFKFSRNASDYRTFINTLYKFHTLLTRGSLEVQDYFENLILQVNFYIDANLVLIENPNTLTTIIIKILLELSDNIHLVSKIKEFTIKCTDIGAFYQSKWSNYLSRFTSLEYLDLSQNLLQSSNYQEQEFDIWGKEKKFPDGLKELKLDFNMFTEITKEFITKLPNSLQSLSLNYNTIEMIEPCSIGVLLPNLKCLDLNYNNLTALEPSIFKDCARGFDLRLKASHLDDTTVDQLKILAKKNGYKVTF